VRREVNARGALQSLQSRCSNHDVTDVTRPLRIGCSFRVPRPLRYRPYGLDGSTLPLAVSSAVWPSRNGFRRDAFSSPTSPLFEFRLRLECYPARPSRQTAVGQHLSWALSPYSTSGQAGPLHAGTPTRYVPPSGFGYPPDGLLPAGPCRFSFAPAALLGFTLRSILLS
jgi:hypothetical protein